MWTWLVNIEYLIFYYGLKIGLKYSKTTNNTICSFKFTYN